MPVGRLKQLCNRTEGFCCVDSLFMFVSIVPLAAYLTTTNLLSQHINYFMNASIANSTSHKFDPNLLTRTNRKANDTQLTNSANPISERADTNTYSCHKTNRLPSASSSMLVKNMYPGLERHTIREGTK